MELSLEVREGIDHFVTCGYPLHKRISLWKEVEQALVRQIVTSGDAGLPFTTLCYSLRGALQAHFSTVAIRKCVRLVSIFCDDRTVSAADRASGILLRAAIYITFKGSFVPFSDELGRPLILEVDLRKVGTPPSNA